MLSLAPPDSAEAQAVIKKHYDGIRKFWYARLKIQYRPHARLC